MMLRCLGDEEEPAKENESEQLKWLEENQENFASWSQGENVFEEREINCCCTTEYWVKWRWEGRANCRNQVL